MKNERREEININRGQKSILLKRKLNVLQIGKEKANILDRYNT